ncbi:MAG: M48 family metalloprotease [Quisquiliibacterium sp.]
MMKLPSTTQLQPGWHLRRQGLLACAIAVALCLPAPATLAQSDNLPRLGDAGSEELTPAAERRIGEAIMHQIRSDPAFSDDAEIADYLNRLAATLTAVPGAAGFSFELFLVLDPTMNAFALPGGFIGVHAGLITAAQTESELASVLAHEIGHVTQRHIARMLSEQKLSSIAMMASMVLAALAARSSPQGAMGIATMAMGAQQQKMLSFSRDAEREADRVGIETLRQADFDPGGMVAFFSRLQQATRLYEGGAPAYMSSHPLTSERIADMQARVQDGRYRQRPDSIDFRLSRAKLQALTQSNVDGLRAARTRLEGQLRDKTTPDEAASWFGLAVVANAQRDFSAAEQALAQARSRLPQGHAFLDRLAAQIRLDADDAEGALKQALEASARHPGARGLRYLQAEALLRLRRHQQAAKFLQDQVELYRTDPVLWRLLSRAHAGTGNKALAHRASAEEYALLGGWLAAIEQLKLARQDGGMDFYTVSQVDARLRELQAIYTREQQDRARR